MPGKLIKSPSSIVSQSRTESLKCASLVQHIRIYLSYLLIKFRGCDSSNSKENIIIYEIPRCNSMNSKENIQEGYRNRLSKTAPEFENCTQQFFTLAMCLPACL